MIAIEEGGSWTCILIKNGVEITLHLHLCFLCGMFKNTLDIVSNFYCGDCIDNRGSS